MFSFVIRTKNEAEKLNEVLISIENQTGKHEYEVIIVDSGSTDKTLEIARNHRCRIIEISSEDFSWGYALNIGISKAKGEFIGLISGHCVLMNDDCLNVLTQQFNDNPDIQVIYGRQCGDSKDDPFEKLNYLEFYPKTNELHKFCDESKYTTAISNACAFFRVCTWKNLKFDEKLQSCEDAKWAEDLQKNGVELAYCGSVGVIHSHPLSADYLYTKSYWREYEMVKLRNEAHGKLYYILKFMVKHMLNDYILWHRKMKTNNEYVKSRIILMYAVIVNMAQMRACLNAKKIGSQIKYDTLDVPKWVTEYEFF